MPSLAFGPHLVIDGFDADHDSLVSVDKVYNFLDMAPESIGMTKIMPPHVVRYDPREGEHEAGLSGFVLIAESHICLHTWPESRQIHLDWFSCKTFDAEKAIRLSVVRFNIKNYNSYLLDRGLEFPRDVSRVFKHLRETRRRGGRS